MVYNETPLGVTDFTILHLSQCFIEARVLSLDVLRLYS
jgi:hypothetical protein